MSAETAKHPAGFLAKGNPSRDGKLIPNLIPARLGRHSGRKTILSPTGQPVNPDRNIEADVTLINALVRAHRWNCWLVTGKYANVKAFAADEGITSPSLCLPRPATRPAGSGHPGGNPQQHPSGNTNPGRFHGSVPSGLGVAAEAVRILKASYPKIHTEIYSSQECGHPGRATKSPATQA